MNTLQTKGYEIRKLNNPQIISALQSCMAEITFEFANNINRQLCNYDTSLFETDLSKKKILFEKVAAIFREELEKTMNGYKPLMINYWIKQPGQADVEIHQNWSHLDEKINRSYTIWIPLQNTDKVNGTMHVIPYSHQIFSNIRPLNSNDYLFRDAPKKFLQQLHVELKLCKGEYVIFDDALMHYTSSNHSQSNREAIQIVVIPENAQPKFYNNNSSQKAIDEYNADENFYQNLSIGSAASRVPKDAVKISEIPVTAPRTLTGIAKIILNRIFKYHHSTEEFSS